METNTNLSTIIDASEGQNLRLDKNIKEFLSDVQVLARIVKYTVTEVEHLEIEEIMECIDRNSVETGKSFVEPGLTNLAKIENIQTENAVLGEGYVTFDIRFSLYHKEQELKIIINIEAQKSSDSGKLGYHLENRIVFYLSRLISSQKQIEFFRSRYDDLKKVYSIWICMDAEEEEDSISRISLKSDTIYGHPVEFSELDKMCGVVIRIRKGKEPEKSKSRLIAMLEDLLSEQEGKRKKELLVSGYGMVMTEELERRVDDMCNLSEVIVERAIQEGLEKGMAEGLEKGMEKGMEKGAFETYASLVRDGILSKEEAAKRLNIQLQEFEKKIVFIVIR